MANSLRPSCLAINANEWGNSSKSCWLKCSMDRSMMCPLSSFRVVNTVSISVPFKCAFSSLSRSELAKIAAESTQFDLMKLNENIQNFPSSLSLFNLMHIYSPSPHRVCLSWLYVHLRLAFRYHQDLKLFYKYHQKLSNLVLKLENSIHRSMAFGKLDWSVFTVFSCRTVCFRISLSGFCYYIALCYLFLVCQKTIITLLISPKNSLNIPATKTHYCALTLNSAIFESSLQISQFQTHHHAKMPHKWFRDAHCRLVVVVTSSQVCIII